MIDSTDPRWIAIENRDASADGTFVFGVRTTRIFCRPSCAARHAKPENVTFFAGCEAARTAGYRACKRCHPESSALDDVEWAKQVCALIDANVGDLITLDALGVQLHVSPGHLQKTFKRVMGITPRQYAEAKRRDVMKQALREGASVTQSIFEAGYNSTSGFYEGMNIGMTPRDYRAGGAGQTLRFTVISSILGCVLIAATERGVSAIRMGENAAALEADLRAEFPKAAIHYDKSGMESYANAVSDYLEGKKWSIHLPLDIQATAFQQQVWQALQTIPYGETRSYSGVAAEMGNPKATRAVAAACGANPVALVIPCHRVVGADGSLTGYHWGIERKKKLLAMEHDAAQAAINTEEHLH